MNTQLRKGEREVRSGFVNLESAGGKLFVTNQRLIFEPHRLNFKHGATEIELSDIQSLSKGWTTLLFNVPIIPNLMHVNTKTGKKLSFVVLGRSKWIKTIQNQQNKLAK